VLLFDFLLSIISSSRDWRSLWRKVKNASNVLEQQGMCSFFFEN
jgi:hypothetical protein